MQCRLITLTSTNFSAFPSERTDPGPKSSSSRANKSNACRPVLLHMEFLQHFLLDHLAIGSRNVANVAARPVLSAVRTERQHL